MFSIQKKIKQKVGQQVQKVYKVQKTSFHSVYQKMQGQFIIELYQKFQSFLKSRQRIRIQIDQKFEGQLDLMEYVILSKFQKNTKSVYKQKKNKKCDKQFKRGFKELLDVQKIYYYNMIVTHLENILNQNLTPPIIQTGSILAPGYSKTYSKIGWKQVLLKLDNDKRYLYVQKNHKLKAYNLNFFLLRKSKTVDYNSFVLEAIDQSVSQKEQQLHFGFKDVKVFRLWFDSLKKIVEFTFWQKIRNMLLPPEVVEILASKHFEEQQSIERKFSEQVLSKQKGTKKEEESQKLYLSTFTSKSKSKSQNLLGSNEQIMDRMSKSVFPNHHVASEHSSDQKSIDQKSIHSIEIKSPRSSIKQDNQMIECQLDDKDGDQTFRSIGLQNLEQGDVQNDGMAMFRKILPEYELSTISKLTQQNKLIHSCEDLQIYSYQNQPKLLKILISFPKNNNFTLSIEKFTSLLCTQEFYKFLNPEIQELQTKTILTTDNCLILYQKNKPFNRLYRSRDFVFVRHIFSPKDSNKCYVVDKSVQDNNVPPFTTIVRGQLTVVYEIFEENGKIKINIEAKVENYGYLKDLQQLNINIKFFKGFEGLVNKIKNIDINKIIPVFSLPQKIINSVNEVSSQKESTPEKQIELRKTHSDVKQFKIEQIQKASGNIEENHVKVSELKKISQQKVQEVRDEQLSSEVPQNQQKMNEIYQSVQTMQFEGQLSTIEPKQIISSLKVVRKFDNQGKVILNQQHLSKRHPIVPTTASQLHYIKSKDNQHPIWKGNWQFLPEGGFKFINQKQIDEQKGVLKFILSQVAKNLVSGKSILNISLPVDIFSAESNLQRFILSMGYAPILLERAAIFPTIDRFLNTIIFGMTNSPLYLQMQKPFNPIIGETFQCYLNGCPAYAQQISHHPPIAAFMMVGRGYMVSAQIESKMKLNINSGTGYNAGVYRVKFDDGQQICYMSPSGEVCGLAYGDRKFNMVGKAYGWSQKSGLFLEIVLNPKKGGFFGKQQTPIDYVEGCILQVTPSFFKSFNKNLSGFPKKNEIIKQEGKFHGRWNKELCYEDKILFSYDTDLPIQIEHQQSPLPSDSNWRQDIAYRRIMHISSAQIWKQKLQIIQRNQRKLRQKYSKK